MRLLVMDYLREDRVQGLLELIFFNLFIEIVDIDGMIRWDAGLHFGWTRVSHRREIVSFLDCC